MRSLADHFLKLHPAPHLEAPHIRVKGRPDILTTTNVNSAVLLSREQLHMSQVVGHQSAVTGGSSGFCADCLSKTILWIRVWCIKRKVMEDGFKFGGVWYMNMATA